MGVLAGAPALFFYWVSIHDNVACIAVDIKLS
jgi:hypothetical protein